MSNFIDNAIKHIQDMREYDWEKYSKEDLLNWLQHSFNCQESLIGNIKRKKLIIKSLEEQIELMKNCENCNESEWTKHLLYSACDCKHENSYCNNYDKWKLKE